MARHRRVRELLPVPPPADAQEDPGRGALLWAIYGVAIEAAPVVVANLVVAGAALYSSVALRRTETRAESEHGL